MKAVLVGVIEEDKLYYIVDAGPDDQDGALVREDGSVVRVDFFSFCTRAYGLKKIRSTRFHRYLWDSPKSTTSGHWYETFISKNKEISKNILNGVNVLSAIGKNKTKIDKKNDSAVEFVKSLYETQNAIATKSADSEACCEKMVKSNSKNNWFSTSEQRKNAWVARILMRDLENQDIEYK